VTEQVSSGGTPPGAGLAAPLSNAEIADRLASLAQLMSAGKENPYKIKAYQRAAARLRTFVSGKYWPE
jgi:hypothetical protein